MEFRKSTQADLDDIMTIIRQAQADLKALEVDQWQNNYPNAETIQSDIGRGGSYVLLKEKKIAATAAVFFSGEKTYDAIYGGQWMTDRSYAVIHRIAVGRDEKGLGLASDIIRNVERLCLERGVYSIRADTHEKNRPMQRLLSKNRFQYCGVIDLENGNRRIAFEKVLCRTARMPLPPETGTAE